jgi:formiminotetrahydrofolate cyclodeaminase
LSGSRKEVPHFADLTIASFAAELGRRSAAPGGGAAAAITAALASSLVAMAARYATAVPRAAEIADESERAAQHALGLADADALAYGRVIAATATARERPAASGAAAIELALAAAADVPLQICELAAQTAQTAADLARTGRPSLVGDALTGAALAAAATRACLVLIEIDLAHAPGDARRARARELVQHTETVVGEVLDRRAAPDRD